MPLFTPQTITRTPIASDNPVNFDNDRAGFGFYHPNNKYFGWQVIPHDNKWSDGTPSFMAPASHYHLLQEEKFHIQSGSGYWFIRGQKIRLSAGDDITIPRFVAHRFESIPNDKEEPLVIQYRYDSQRWEMEERFFRHILPYMYDCKRAGQEPSILQLMVFLTDCWMPIEVIPAPGGEYVRCAVNALFMWTCAFIGFVFFGYRRSYNEYYVPEVSKRLIEEESRKRK